MSKKLFCNHCNKKTKFVKKWNKDSDYTYAHDLYCSKCNIYIKTILRIDSQSFNIIYKGVK